MFVVSGFAIFAPATADALLDPCNPTVIVYEHINKGGKSHTLCGTGSSDKYNLWNGGMGLANDTISSIQVLATSVAVRLHQDCFKQVSGNVCDHSRMGRVMEFPYGTYNLTDFGFNDSTSAITIIDLGSDNYIVKNVLLYSDINEDWGSDHYPLNTNNTNRSDLRPYYCQNVLNCNDKISSVYVPYGKKVTLYQDINYGGKSITLGVGVYNLTNYKMSGSVTWNDQTSSYKIQ